MGALPANAYGRVTMSFTGPGLPYRAMTMLEFERTLEEPPETFLGRTRDGWLSACSDLHQLVASNACYLDTIEVKVGPESTGPSVVIPAGVRGESGTEACPPNVALLVRKYVPGSSNRFSGRLFYPGISEGNVGSDGTVPTPALGPYQEAFDDFLDAIRPQGVMDPELTDVPCVYPQVIGKGADGVDEVRAVYSLDVQHRVATQRRRLRR